MQRSAFLPRFFGIGLAGVLGFAIFRVEFHSRSELSICVWDVGQGDAIWIRFPNGEKWLLDTGGRIGRSSAALRVALPEMASELAFSVDKIVLSHPDQDHAFGTLDLLHRWRVKEIAVNSAFEANPPPLLRRIEEEALAISVPLRWVESQTHLQRGATHVRILPTRTGNKPNNQELVVLLSHAACRLLFLGDAEKEAELVIASWLDGPIDFLKIAHHGSRSSTTPALLHRARPRLSAISVGARNRYGHPHGEVVRRILDHGSELLRTDRHGFVELRVSDAGTITCRSAAGFCGEYRCRANQNSP